MLRNCRRSWFTSDGVKPAVRRRSKPRGAEVVLGSPVVVDERSVDRPGVEGCRREAEVGGGRAAAWASVLRSDGVSSSPMLQFT